MMAEVVEAAEKVLNVEVNASLQLQVGLDELLMITQEPEKADMEQWRVVKLFKLVVGQQPVHLCHDSRQDRGRGLGHGQTDKRPRSILVDKNGETTFPGNAEIGKVPQTFAKVRDEVFDPVVLEDHHLAEADVWPRNDLRIDPKFAESVEKNFLKDVEAVVDWCKDIRGPIASNVLETPDTKFVQAWIVVWNENTQQSVREWAGP